MHSEKQIKNMMEKYMAFSSQHIDLSCNALEFIVSCLNQCLGFIIFGIKDDEYTCVGTYACNANNNDIAISLVNNISSSDSKSWKMDCGFNESYACQTTTVYLASIDNQQPSLDGNVLEGSSTRESLNHENDTAVTLAKL